MSFSTDTAYARPGSHSAGLAGLRLRANPVPDLALQPFKSVRLGCVSLFTEEGHMRTPHPVQLRARRHLGQLAGLMSVMPATTARAIRGMRGRVILAKTIGARLAPSMD